MHMNRGTWLTVARTHRILEGGELHHTELTGLVPAGWREGKKRRMGGRHRGKGVDRYNFADP